jgi:hypothetical protein
MRPINAGFIFASFLLSITGCGDGSSDRQSTEPEKRPEVKTLTAEKPATETKRAPSQPEQLPAVSRQEAMQRAKAAMLGTDLEKTTDSLDRAEILAKIKEVGAPAKGIWNQVVAALKDEDSTARAAALEALVAIDAGLARPYLENGLKDLEAEVRRAAAESWRVAGIKDVLPLLKSVVEETDPRTQLAAMMSIEKLADPSLTAQVADTVKYLDPSAAKPAVRFLMANKAKDQGPKLIDLVNWQDAELRAIAARALQDLGVNTKPALLALVRALTDEQMAVRRAAIDALKSLTGTNLPYDPEDKAGLENTAKLWKDWVDKNG